MTSSVSCIVPAFNEGARIGAVLKVVASHPLIDEVIVVDDASTDNTVVQVKSFSNVKLIRQSRNLGKSAAAAAGLRAATGQVIVFVDADLVGIDAALLGDLILPVITGQAEATISLRGNAPWLWRAIGLDYISGERAMIRNLAPDPDRLDDVPRFGMEVLMNKIWLAKKMRLQVVAWPGVSSPMKHIKQGWWRGLRSDLRMMCDIFATAGLGRILAQICGMIRLCRASETRSRLWFSGLGDKVHEDFGH